jgi:hypothetical protein
MAVFIEVHTIDGARRVNIDHIVYYAPNTDQDNDKYPGYVLCDRAMMHGLHTAESYREIYKMIYEAQTGCKL